MQWLTLWHRCGRGVKHCDSRGVRWGATRWLGSAAAGWLATVGTRAPLRWQGESRAKNKKSTATQCATHTVLGQRWSKATQCWDSVGSQPHSVPCNAVLDQCYNQSITAGVLQSHAVSAIQKCSEKPPSVRVVFRVQNTADEKKTKSGVLVLTHCIHCSILRVGSMIL